MTREKEISSTSRLLEIIKTDNREKSVKPSLEYIQPEKKPSFISLLSRNVKGFSFKKKDVVGVDFTGRFLSLVRLAHSIHGFKLINARSVPVPAGTGPEDPGFSSFLKRSLEAFTGRDNNISIWTQASSSKTEIWTIKVPVVRTNQARAIFWTAKKEKPFNANEYLFDYMILDEIRDSGIKKKLVCAYIVPRSEVMQAKGVFAGAGYQLEGITASPFAFRNLFQKKIVESGDKPFAVLYIAHDFSRIDVHRGKNLLLSRVIKTGMDSMAESLLHETVSPDDQYLPGIDTALVENKGEIEEIYDLDKGYELLLSFIKKNSAAHDDHEFPMISPVLERLSRQIERTFDHFVNVQGYKPVEKVLLTGFPSALSGLSDFFAGQLGISVENIDPLGTASSLYSSSLVLGRTERLGLALATALALSDNSHTPNFLYTSKDHEQQRTAKKINIAAAACSMLLVLSAALYLWHGSGEVDRMAAEKLTLQKKLNEFDPLVTRDMVADISGKFLEEQHQLRRMSNKYTGIAVMSEFSNLVPENISILNVLLDMDESPVDFAPPEGIVILDGIVKGDPGIQETSLSIFLLRLNKSPLFREANIQRSGKEHFQIEGEVLRFSINISLGVS